MSNLPPEGSGLELEYNAAKQEVLKRIDVRYQIISIAVTIAGAFYGFGWNSGAIIILIFPVIGFCLALGWMQNEVRIKHLNNYIYERLGKTISGLGWAAYLHEKSADETAWYTPLLSPGIVFALINVTTIALGLLKGLNTFPEFFMLGLDIILLAGLWTMLSSLVRASGYSSF